MLQSGSSNVYAPPSSLIGTPLVCIVQASNPGGVTTFRSATTPPITPDVSPPVASIDAVRCRLHACTLSITATDPRSVALGVQPWVSYTATTRCPAKKGPRAPGPPSRASVAGRPPCTSPSATPRPASYRATARGLPYNQSVTFIAVVTNAAGLHPGKLLVRPVTLHPPTKQKEKHKNRPGSRHSKH